MEIDMFVLYVFLGISMIIVLMALLALVLKINSRLDNVESKLKLNTEELEKTLSKFLGMTMDRMKEKEDDAEH